MTIQEALKSGKRFRRRNPDHPFSWISPKLVFHTFEKEEILADDWEIEEENVTVTKSQLQYALGMIPDWQSYLNEIYSRLGFK